MQYSNSISRVSNLMFYKFTLLHVYNYMYFTLDVAYYFEYLTFDQPQSCAVKNYLLEVNK